jgi:hypothetical protein
MFVDGQPKSQRIRRFPAFSYKVSPQCYPLSGAFLELLKNCFIGLACAKREIAFSNKAKRVRKEVKRPACNRD